MNMISNLLRGGTQDAVAILEADHREVEQLFTRISSAQGKQRSKLVQQLATALSLHMDIEESIVYPRLGKIDKEMSSEAKAEHGLARKVLKDLQRLSPDSPGFDGALEMVKAGIEHHVQEEEHEAFPKLRSALNEDEMEDLTDKVRSAKERGRAPRRSSSASSRSRSSSSRRSSGSRSTSRPASGSAARRSSKAASKRSSSSTSSSTKAELVRRAKRQGVTGYSSMTKDELARALR